MILNNPWFIGIGGGIISGLIVYFATNFIISKKVDKVYLQKIEQANSEIVHILKPYVISKKQFSIELFTSIISSISKKYSLETKDILPLEEVLNEIVTDIMQTSFLTEEQKETYSLKLLAMKQKPKQKEKIIYLNRKEYSAISTKTFSFVLATTTVLMMMLTTVFFSYKYTGNSVYKASTSFLILSTLIPIILTFAMMLLSIRSKLFNSKKEHLKNKNLRELF